MAIKTINFLPSVFRSDTNQKFLNATLDQLVTPPDLRKMHGYIGRTNAPTFKTTDNYQPEPTALRQQYQLEPSVVVKNDNGDINFFSSYIDLLQQIKHEGGLIDNQSRLFSGESYSFDGLFDFDKFVNFNQYYWLPNGPDAVDVYGSGVDIEREFVVTRDPVSGTYNISGYGTLDNPTLKLARGGVYTFVVNQPGFPFWVQSYPGVDGLRPLQKNIGTRNVLGVTNNGIDQGTITFRVPQAVAQDYYTRMPTVGTADLSTGLGYREIQNQLLSTINRLGGMDGVKSQLMNKTIIFTNQEIDDIQWTVDGETVPVSERRGLWRINLIDNGAGDFIFNLVPNIQVKVNQKVYVKGGIKSGEKTFYYDPDAIAFLEVPDLTAIAPTLYYQDGVSATMVGGMDIVEANNSTINVDTEIVGKKNYTSPSGLAFTNGLKVRFDTSAVPNSYDSKTYYVEGVGTSIKLIPVNDLVAIEDYATNGLTDKDYITIKRNSQDLNGWSRSNRWFHIDVILATAEYNKSEIVIDQSTRANRPIIEFDADLQLLNYGRVAKTPIDILYNPAIPGDAFEDIELQSTYILDGVVLTNGMRVVFANDVDPNVKNNIYIVNKELIGGVYVINLILADDYDVQPYHSLNVLRGSSAGKVYFYDGSSWVESTVNAKVGVNQEPLFDVVDASDYSLADAAKYPGSNFSGTKIFSYLEGTGTNDPYLGFPLSYRNFNQIGDIQFENNFDSDTFSYTDNVDVPINRFVLRKNSGLTDYIPRNIWVTNSEQSKQFQIIQGTYDGVISLFEIDITANVSGQLPYIRVYKNSVILKDSQYRVVTSGVKRYIDISNSNPEVNDHIDILIYSDSISELGFYEVPKNLDFNTENRNFTSLTLGQLRNHLTTIVENCNRVVGTVPGSSNLRDIEFKQQGGSIVQHASPVIYSELFLVDTDANFIKGLNLARHEYSNIKNKFLEMAFSTPDLDLNDPVSSTDVLLKKINAVKNKSFPWYYSDMVPYGDAVNVIEYPIVNVQIRGYEITSIFSDTTLSNQAVLVYINNVQLIKGYDYEFDTTRAGFTISDSFQLNAGDTLTIVEYSNTDGNYIPETPTKLGLYPKFTPSMYLDTTYQTPTMVIQGHDGSITPAFGDFRDDLLLEFEKRIYNNIKVNYETNEFNIYDYLPGKFRTQDYSFTEFNRLLTAPFLQWAGGNRVDFTNNSYFEASNPWTWNYRRFTDSIDGEQMTGAWRSVFKFMFDTDRPHTHPWEMLGFSEMPSWWEKRYGPAPYTGGNLVLWDEMSQGYIHGGPRAGYDTRFARPVLTSYIPVDEYGNLRSPEQFLVSGFNSNDANASYAVGDQGPVETAWRRSSDFPFAMQQAIALSRPAYYFGSLMNVTRYYKNTALNQYVLSDTMGRITPTEIRVNGETINNAIIRSAGYINWIADSLTNQGISPGPKLSAYLDDNHLSVQLAYKMAGFSDKSLMNVIAEQSSPTSTNSGVIIPAENYDLILHKSAPTNTIVYSAVIVEKSDNGYTVSGYNQGNPYFTIIPSVANNNAYGITVNGETGVIYNDFQQYKLTVPYGYEFTNKQQVVDFLVSYERYLQGMGMVFTEFDQDLEVQRDFKLSVREFLVWSQQGWASNNLIVLSPVLNKIFLSVDVGTIDEVTNTPTGSRILDTNFGFIRSNQFTVVRQDNTFTLTANFGQTIALASLNVIEYEHAIIFDNTTVFNDIIYKPELGNRQYRLQLVGSKTGSWTGEMNPPGFIYNDPTVDAWVAGTDYNKGTLVTFKGLYYVAIDNLAGTTDFVISDWRQIPGDQIKSGLLPNFSYNAQRFNNIFDIDNPEPTMGMEDFSQGMIGFSPRQYMTDFGIDKTTQAKFYQGFIKEKGTINAVNAFTAAGFNGVTSTVNLYEEWAMRTGAYGALENNRYVEVSLYEDVFTGDPTTFTLLPSNGVSTDKIVGVTPDQLYRAADGYRPAIYLNRDDSSIYENDILTAGYVNENDVDTTIYDIGNYRLLNSILSDVRIGYKIWAAKDFTGEWNVYRVNETNSVATSLSYSVDNAITVTTKKPNTFAYGDLIVIKGFDDRFDGFYQVSEVIDATRFNIIMTGSTLDQMKAVQNLNGLSPIFRLLSQRLQQPTDISTMIPAKTWRDGDKLWADDTGDGTWAVYNKSTPWLTSNANVDSMSLNANTYVNNSGFGTVAAINSTGKLAAAGMPNTMNGNVAVFVANVTNGNVLTQIANIGTTDSVTGFGGSIEVKGNIMYVGAPGNGTSQPGRLYVYSHDGNTTVTKIQTISSNWNSNTGDYFGYSVSASTDNKWLFVGAPAKGNVEVFHANANNYYTYANTITVGSYANVSFGSIVKTTSDSSQTIITAPYERVDGISAAGAVYVFDRSIESFVARGDTKFVTQHNIDATTVLVNIDQVIQTSGYTIGGNLKYITFTNAPVAGSLVTIETNKFQLMEKLTAPSLTSGASFGGSADISGDDADIYVSSPGYSKPGYHSGLVYRFVNTGERYGEVLATIPDPLVSVGDSVRINGQLVTFGANSAGSLVGNLQSIVANINSANIAGITATTTLFNSVSILSNIATNVDKLVLTPGNNGNVLANLGITVYTNTQTISHLGDDDINGFGTQVAVTPSGNNLVISGPGSTTYNNMVIDTETTLLDRGSTTFLDPIPSAGAVYVYGMVDSALSGGAQDQLVFVQRLQNPELTPYDQFGTSIAVSDDTLLIGAPGDDSAILSIDPITSDLTYTTNGGAFYTYNNFSGNVGWDIISQQTPKVDIDSITRLYLFDTITNSILTNLDHIDPAKGKLLGVAEQDIDFWTSYDPAVYNTAGSTDYVTNDVGISLDYNWGADQVGKTWWNLDLVRFIDYEQGPLTYRANNWGDIFPGSRIQIAEWVVSNNMPGQYIGDGTPLYDASNNAFVTETYVDPTSKVIRSRYYFWVVGKTSVDTNQTPRTNSIQTLENMITNPQAQGIPYAAILRDDTISLYNVSGLIGGNTTVLHADYDFVRNDNIIHSEYQLVQEGNTNSIIPERIVNKLRDSLAGVDQFNNMVPDPSLSVQTRVGIDRKQSIFVDRIAAVKNWVGYVNKVLMKTPVVNDFIIDRLYSAEEQPSAEDYDMTVATYEELSYINVDNLYDGYVVLVINDETQQNLWATYTFNRIDENTAAFTPTRLQSYYTPFYWSKVDWYEMGNSTSIKAYDHTVKPTYQVAVLSDIQKLTLKSGDTVKVLNNGKGQWEVYRYDDNLTESLVGVQGGTVQLNEKLWDGTAASQYEIRVIFDTLQHDIFVESLNGKFNEMFFFLINYILTEQKTVDWLFKTSFVSIVHQLRKLEQFPNYIRDNQTYYESYINEVKPYRTSLREYLVDYQGNDSYEHDVTDFDLPSTYDSSLEKYRSPDLTLDKDINTVSTNPLYTDWYNNYGYSISSVDVVRGGDTVNIPVVTLGLYNSNATVYAGDYITQLVTGANGSVQVNSVDTIITLNDVVGSFTNTLQTLKLDVNANVWVGNTITQLSTGAQGSVLSTSTGNVITLGNIVGSFGNVGNTYIYRDSANLTANVQTVTVDNAYIYRNGSNLQVNVDAINFYTLSSGGYFETPLVSVVGGGGSGANVIAHIDPVTQTIARFEVIDPGTGYTGQPSIQINGTGTGAVGYARLIGQRYIDSVPSIDVRLSNNVTVYTGNVVFQPNSVSQGTVYTNVIDGNIITLTDVVGTFTTGNWIYNASSNLSATITSINSYTQFVDKSYNKIRTFDSNIKFDRVSYTSSVTNWAPNITVSANTTVRYNGAAYRANETVYSTTTMKLNGNIVANVGDYVTQENTTGNATVVSASGVVLTVSNIAGSFVPRNGNISINGVPTTVRPATVNNIFDFSKYTTVGSGDFDNANDRIMAFYSPIEGMPGRELSKLVYGIEYPGVQVQGVKFDAFSSNITSNVVSYHHGNLSLFSSNVSVFDFTNTEYAVGEYLTVANLDLPSQDNLKFKIVSINNDKLVLSEISGNTFNIRQGSNVAMMYYDNNNPVYMDSSIQSAYLDTDLGTRPEDINIDGGSYYDTFSSHAPEELVPGQTFDHLNMQVYTKIASNTRIIAYRIVSNARSNSSATFNDNSYWPEYYKIANTSVLTSNLNLTDTTISVIDAGAFTAPSIAMNRPGVIYINGEKIVYWRNYATEGKTAWSANVVIDNNKLVTYSGNTYLTTGNVYGSTFSNIMANVALVDVNTLSQIRRGVDKTGTPLVHLAGSNVEETSEFLRIPSIGDDQENVHIGSWLDIAPGASDTLIDELGNELVDETGREIITGLTGDVFDGSGIEGSSSPQALFLKS